MADSILSADRLREVVHYDPDTGVFTRKVRLAQRHKAGDRADFRINHGGMTGYRRLSVDRKRYLAHRCAWLYVHGEWPEHDIDHVNGDKSDNRIANLRDVPNMVNRQNVHGPRIDNSSGFLGVYFHPQTGKWRARISHAGKSISLGLFDSPQSAHESYLETKRVLHSGCTI